MIAQDVMAAFRAFCDLPTQTDTGTFEASFAFPADLPVFKGHFPGNPIVPGVLLIECVRYALSQKLARPMRLVACARVKFKGLIRPAQEFELKASYRPLSDESYAVKASISYQGETMATFAMSFKPKL